MTQRLYRQDPLLLEFDAVVEHVEPAGDGWKVELDRTAFYPEGGGQPADQGTLDAIPVTHVQEEDDCVMHFTATPLTEGRAVHGVVNAARRRDFMQQHTGQHVISAAFWKEASLVTIAVHMGAEYTTIDLDTSEISPEQIETVTRLVDHVIKQDFPLDAIEAAPQDLPRFTLRKPPPVDGPVRLVRIGDFDCVGCCGLHLPSTAGIRLAACTGWERIRGKVRTHWQIGDRAVAFLEKQAHILGELRELTATRNEELADAVRRLQAGNAELRGYAAILERRLAESLTRDLLAATKTVAETKIVTRILDGEPLDIEKSIVKALLAVDNCAFALVNPLPDRLSWTLGVPPEFSMNFPAMKQQHLDPLGARGGGRPPLWQGSAPMDTRPSDLLAALEQILQDTQKQ